MTATEPSTIHSTFVIERSYPQSPDRVYSAFAQPARKRRWYAEGDHEIQEFEMEFRVGGSERLRYRFKEGHPIAGSEIANESTYQDIVPEKHIVMAQKMSLNGKPITFKMQSEDDQADPEGHRSDREIGRVDHEQAPGQRQGEDHHIGQP